MGRAIAPLRAIFVSPGRAYIAAYVMWHAGLFCGGSMGANESSSPGHVAAGTASMLAICIFSAKP